MSLVGDALHFLPRLKRPRILVTPRIGVDYAGEWKGKLLRFVDAESTAARIRVTIPSVAKKKDAPVEGRVL